MMKNFIAIFFFLSLFLPSVIQSSIGLTDHRVIIDLPKTFDTASVTGYQFFRNKGILFDTTSNPVLYNEVYGWLGVPYRWGGKTKSGADCSGFASAIYKNVYSYVVGGSAGDIYKMLVPVEKDNLKEGDLVFFKINRTYISHVGVYLSNNKFIHETSWGHGVQISDLNENYYKTYYYSAARIPVAIPADTTTSSEKALPKP